MGPFPFVDLLVVTSVHSLVFVVTGSVVAIVVTTLCVVCQVEGSAAFVPGELISPVDVVEAVLPVVDRPREEVVPKSGPCSSVHACEVAILVIVDGSLLGVLISLIVVAVVVSAAFPVVATDSEELVAVVTVLEKTTVVDDVVGLVPIDTVLPELLELPGVALPSRIFVVEPEHSV